MHLKYKSACSENSGSAAVFLFNDGRAAYGQKLPSFAAGLLDSVLAQKEFKAEALSGLPLKHDRGWLLLVGLGRAEEAGPALVFEASAKAVQMAAERGLKKLDLLVPEVKGLSSPEEVLEAAALGTVLAAAPRLSYKKKEKAENGPAEITFIAGPLKKAAEVMARAETEARAVMLARRLGETPANLMYPQTFAAEARKLAKAGRLSIEVLDEKALAQGNFNLILAVGAGSARPPRLVRLSYAGGRKNEPPVVLVGKGVTFDSGGMSLKPAGALDGMKTDMSGAAAVLAATLAAAEMKLPLNLTAIMPLAENMPDGAGFRVGDVISGRSGRSVEITNTDAEGRLILADALAWAGELKPALVIDVATLTGACVVALGDRCAGLFSEDEPLREGLLKAAGSAGEMFWPMPLFREYEDLLKSEIADTISANTTAKGGGAIAAALFLKAFAPSGRPWAHLDIAGPARSGRARPGRPAGATGFGVLTLLKYLIDRSRG